jgi:hypothetical protein
MYFKKIDDLLAEIAVQREALQNKKDKESKLKLVDLNNKEAELISLKARGKTKTATVKRNGIQMKIVNFVFPWTHNFVNWCPLGWMLIAAIPLFVPVTVGRGIVAILVGVGNGLETIITFLSDWLEYTYIPWKYKREFDKLNPDLLAKWDYWRNHCYEMNLPVCTEKKFKKLSKMLLLIGRHTSGDIYEKVRDKVKNVSINTAWFKELQSRRAALEQDKINREREVYESFAKRKERNQKIANKIIKITKVIGWPILIMLSVIFVYYAFFFIGWLLYWIWHGIVAVWFIVCAVFWYIVAAIPVIIAVSLIIVTFCFGVYFIVKSLVLMKDMSLHTPYWLCVFGHIIMKVLRPIGHALIWPFNLIGHLLVAVCPPVIEGIIDFFGFFITMIKNWKNKECPYIIWEDEKN